MEKGKGVKIDVRYWANYSVVIGLLVAEIWFSRPVEHFHYAVGLALYSVPADRIDKLMGFLGKLTVKT